MAQGDASFSWVPTDLIERAEKVGADFGFPVVSIEGGPLAMVVDLGDGRRVYVVVPADDTAPWIGSRPRVTTAAPGARPASAPGLRAPVAASSSAIDSSALCARGSSR
jgi:hypothetical protein